jgi:hypothetical protein
MDIVTRKTHAWAAKRFNLPVERIESVEFTTVYGGYCETCGYETTGVEIKVGGSYEKFETGDIEVAELVREISAMEVD